MVELERSLPAAAADLARRHPQRGVELFDTRGRSLSRRTHLEVLAAARVCAERLSGLGLREGDRVVVCLPTSWGWFDTWLGALLLGAWPLAAAPELGGRRVSAIAAQVRAGAVVCTPALRAELDGGTAARVVTAQELASAPRARGFREARPEPSTPAFLQLTSGSTGTPRAVMISHRAVLHQADCQDRVVGAPFGGRSRERFDGLVSWLPLNHDMGLLGIFYALLSGVDLWLLPPRAFLGRPRLWLDLLGSRGTTVTAAPNFGYHLASERLRERDLAGLDLSGFGAALTGAEMVRADTIAEFCDRLGRCGFERRSFRPCYGLAESTLAVTLDVRGEGPRTLPPPPGSDCGLGVSELVGLGPPIPDTELRIVAPDGGAAAAGAVGEVLVRGPSLFNGYFDDDAASAATLVDGWLRTGDLGFMDRGELFIAGRLKDVLIVRGQNLMPHELERLTESAAGGGGSLRAAAFTVARGSEGEEVVVALEVATRNPEALATLAAEVRSRIGREMGLPLADVVLVKRGRIPKTTSGKVRRAELRERYIGGRLERLGGGG